MRINWLVFQVITLILGAVSGIILCLTHGLEWYAVPLIEIPTLAIPLAIVYMVLIWGSIKLNLVRLVK